MRPLPRPQPRRRPALGRPSRFTTLRPTTLRPTTLAVVATALTFVLVRSTVGGVEDARSRWEPITSAHIAATDLAAGHVVGPGDVARVEVPQSLLPAGAVATDPIGRTIRADVEAGEILVGHRLSGVGAEGLGAMLGPNQRGVAVPRSGVDLPLSVGDQVDVLATLDPTATRGDPTLLLVERATVIAVDDETVTLAVDQDDASTLTHALVTATVTLALVA